MRGRRNGTTDAVSAVVGAEVMMFQGNPRDSLRTGRWGLGDPGPVRLAPAGDAEGTRLRDDDGRGDGLGSLRGAGAGRHVFPLQILCIDLRVVGAVTSVLGMLAFVLHYTRRERWLKPRRFGAICALPLALLVVSWTNPWHRVFWSSIRWDRVDGFEMAIRGYGPGFWCNSDIATFWSPFPCSCSPRRSSGPPGVYRAQAAVMLFGVLVPWVVSIIDMSHVFGVFYVDMAAASFAVTGLAFVPGLSRFRLLDLKPVAWATVVERITTRSS